MLEVHPPRWLPRDKAKGILALVIPSRCSNLLRFAANPALLRPPNAGDSRGELPLAI